jgi:hypothetical protein
MAADTDNDNGNGRVTVAILGQKIDYMSQQVGDLLVKLDKHCDESNVRDNRLTKLETQTEVNSKEIATLRTKSDFWNSLNSLGAILAGVLGVNK